MRELLPAWINRDRLAPGMTLSGQLDLSRLDQWPVDEGSVQVNLEFAQASSGRLALKGNLVGSTRLTCQRCLQDMPVNWETDIQLELVDNQEQAARIDTALDICVLQDGKLLLHELVGDECLLALPMAVRHEPGECTAPDNNQAF